MTENNDGISCSRQSDVETMPIEQELNTTVTPRHQENHNIRFATLNCIYSGNLYVEVEIRVLDLLINSIPLSFVRANYQNAEIYTFRLLLKTP